MKVQVNIRGRPYTFRSDEDDVDLVAVARYVESRMAEVGQKATGFDEYTIAMLAALNIASDFEKFRRQVDAEFEGVDRDIASTMVLLEAALPSEEDDLEPTGGPGDPGGEARSEDGER